MPDGAGKGSKRREEQEKASVDKILLGGQAGREDRNRQGQDEEGEAWWGTENNTMRWLVRNRRNGWSRGVRQSTMGNERQR
jgi:hypothetical protein